MNLRFRPRFGAAAPSRLSIGRKLRVESLEVRAVPAAPVIDAIPTQTLTSNQTTRQIPIPATDADNDPLTFTARAAGTEAYFLASDLELKAGGHPTNWGQQGEKWFKGNDGLYFITPTGEFHKSTGGAHQASGPLLATLPPAFFLYPELVTNRSDADLAYLLDQQLGLAPTVSPASNSLGLGEQWLQGNGQSRFFLTPSGDLYRATGRPIGSTQTLVAHLDSAYFRDTRLLSDAQPHPLPIQQGGELVTIGALTGAAGNYVVEVTASDATVTARRTFGVHVSNTNIPAVGVAGQVLGADEETLTVDLASTDLDTDSLSYEVRTAGTEAYFLAIDLGLKNGSGRKPNWGGQGEKWFLGKDGWYFLKPSGDFHKWNGANRQATGERLATLQPAFFVYTELLTKPMDEDLAYVLDRKVSLSPTIKPAENSLGQGERWLRGRGGYFFITPAGNLYKQGADSPLIANLGSVYFNELNRLYAAQPDRFSATAANGVLTVTTKPNYFGQFVVQVRISDGVNTTTQLIPIEQRFVDPPPGSTTTNPPRVVSALSTGNKTVVVSYSQAMSNSAVDPANYGIIQTNINSEAADLIVVDARFLSEARDAVELTTLSQSSVAYTLSVVNVRDLSGKQFGPPAATGGLVIDPSKAQFSGKGPSGDELVDTDGDGLTDDQEQNGWSVQTRLVNGNLIARGVSSDPFNSDTDGDGITDALEANLRSDPRDPDSDDDQLNDYQEFNEVFSNLIDQDSDGDGLDDNVEFGFFRTSPNQADTDGDQLADGAEVLLGNRKARVADLPAPSLSISDTRIGLDVRFTETTTTGTRELETKNVSSSLKQGQSKSFSNSGSSEYEIASKISQEYGYEITAEAGSQGGSFSVSASETFGTELTTSGKWTTSYSEESSRQTESAFEESRTTDKERTEGSSLERTVQAATLQATVFLRNISNLGYRLKNLQLTASIQDPQNPTKLTPVATLIPEFEPADGYSLGPLGADKGPIIFTNTTIFPALAESLMENPRGLVYQFSNYDIVDEFGRNFAFTARDVVDRTSSLVIDYGGFDSNGDGEGDFTEYRRISTSGGRVIDTNGDGAIDDADHRVLFDGNGQEVGITLRESLAAIGLTHFDEATTSSNSLSEAQLNSSYSTRMVEGLGERIFRIRKTQLTPGSNKNWEVITRTGIDRTLGLDDVFMTADSGARLAFVQDIDGDGLPANVEFLNGTSDNLMDTDGDNLDDRFELLIGWETEITPLGSKHVFSRASLADTDRDGIQDDIEAPSIPFDRNGDGLPDEYQSSGEDDLITDPSQADTDGDGIDDKTEVDGYEITLYQTPEEKANGVPPTIVFRQTDPTNLDTDGDTAPDGLERTLGGDPTDINDRDKFSDADRDGIVNIVEQDGWDIVVYGISTKGFQQGVGTTVHVTSDWNNPDTDGDGLLDGAEYRLFYNPSGTPGGLISVRTNPRSADTDGDGLGDRVEALGFNLRDLGVILLDPRDADSDNDRLSDGEEAELQDVETERWVVRVIEKDPYRVYSDPRQADQDFDGLVDGQEKFVFNGNTRVRKLMADPTKSNTDGDRRSDLEDVMAGLDPLEEDFRVTVAFKNLDIKQDGDEQSSEGEIAFDFGVRFSDDTTATGLSDDFTSVLREQWQMTGTLQSDPSTTSEVESILGPDDGYGITTQSGNSIAFAGVVPDANRTITFNMTRRKRFSIEGVVVDVDNIDLDPNKPRGRNDNVTYVYLGGLDGVMATTSDNSEIRTVFNGEDLANQLGQLQELTFDTDESDCIQGADNTSNEPISVTMRAYMLVD